MKFKEFQTEIKEKFEEVITEDREEATENFGSKRNMYLHGYRDALDFVVKEMEKVESKESGWNEETIKTIIVKPNYNDDEIEWEAKCPFCGKENIAFDSGDDIIDIGEWCEHFYHFDHFDGMFTFRLKEGG
jgi:hypothetical protein